MTEESLVLGRPPKPPGTGGRGRWAGRGPGIAAAAVLLGLTGWTVWHEVVDDGPAAAPTPAPLPVLPHRPTAASRPPAVPYLRSGALVRPGGRSVGVPDASWTDVALLADGRVVLAQDESLTVLRGGTPYSAGLVGGLTERPDGTAVAWTGPDGRVRRLSVGSAAPVVMPQAQQLVPGCRGLRVGADDLPGWQSCDRAGRLLSPGGAWVARIGNVSVSVVPRIGTAEGASVAFLGVVDDAVWEDHDHLLVVVRLGDEGHLLRVGTDGSSGDVITPVRGADDPARPALVLPVTSPWLWMQP